MPRVLHVITILNPGGAENHLLSLSRGLLARGYQIEVAYLKEGYGGLAPTFESSGIPVHPLHMRAWGDVSAFLRLVHLPRTRQYDIIHTHLPRADLYGAIAARVTGIPTVISTKHSESFSVTSPLGELTGRLAERYISHSIAISDHLRRFYLKERIAVCPEHISTVHYGLSVKDFVDGINLLEARRCVRAGLGIAPEALVVGTVTRLVPEKPNAYLLQAFAMLRPQIRQAHLLIVGHGRQREELEALAAELEIERDVTFAGFRRDVAAVMASLDVFVLNSVREAFGLVLLEAMALAKPVVATRAGAIPEIVEDGKTGILVPVRDTQALAAAILELLRDPHRRHAMGEKGFERVGREFSVEKMVEKTEEIYRRYLCGER